MKVSLNNLRVDDLKQMANNSKQQDEVEFLDEAQDMIDLEPIKKNSNQGV